MKPVLYLLFLLALLGCTKAKWESYSPPSLPDEEEYEPTGDTIRMRVMSVGTKQDNEAISRYAVLADSLNVDFIIAREMDKNNNRSGRDVDQPKNLSIAANMPDYLFVSGQDYKGGEFGITIYSKHEIRDTKTSVFPTNRPFGLIQTNVDGHDVYFAGAQLDDGTSASAAANRLKQVESLLEITANIDGPMILAGNFFIQDGAVISDPTVQALGAQFSPGCTSCGFTLDNAIADFILYKWKGEVIVEDYKVFPQPISPLSRKVAYAELAFVL